MKSSAESWLDHLVRAGSHSETTILSQEDTEGFCAVELMGDATRNMIFRMRLHKGMAGIHTKLFNVSGDTKRYKVIC